MCSSLVVPIVWQVVSEDLWNPSIFHCHCNSWNLKGIFYCLCRTKFNCLPLKFQLKQWNSRRFTRRTFTLQCIILRNSQMYHSTQFTIQWSLIDQNSWERYESRYQERHPASLAVLGRCHNPFSIVLCGHPFQSEISKVLKSVRTTFCTILIQIW